MPAKDIYDEQELLIRLGQGDESAFTAIYNRYWDKLYFLAYSHLRSADIAEEIVQEIFLVLWKKRAALDIRSLSLYLAAMVRYAIYSNLARRKKHRQIDISALPQEPAGEGEEFSLDNKQFLEVVQKLSARLPEKCRLVFLHNKLLDQPLDQVARELKISNKTAEAHLTKALKVIRGKFRDSLTNFLFF